MGITSISFLFVKIKLQYICGCKYTCHTLSVSLPHNYRNMTNFRTSGCETLFSLLICGEVMCIKKIQFCGITNHAAVEILAPNSQKPFGVSVVQDVNRFCKVLGKRVDSSYFNLWKNSCTRKFVGWVLNHFQTVIQASACFSLLGGRVVRALLTLFTMTFWDG